jgi:hypothetical protein
MRLVSLGRICPRQFSTRPHFAQAEYLEARYFMSGYLLSSQGDQQCEGRYGTGRCTLDSTAGFTIHKLTEEDDPNNANNRD